MNLQEVTKEELISLCVEANYKNPINCRVVFSKENWSKEFSEESRTYCFSSANKCFDSNMCGSSLFATSLEKPGVITRIENWLLLNTFKVEHCYIER